MRFCWRRTTPAITWASWFCCGACSGSGKASASSRPVASEDAVDLVDIDVDGKVAVGGDKLDDRDSGLRYDCDVIRDSGALHYVCEGAKDSDLVHVCHAVGLDDQIYVTGTLDFE